MTCHDDDLGARVFEAIGDVPRRGGRDPGTMPRALLDLPEAARPRRPWATLVLLAVLALLYAARIPQHTAPAPAHAAPPASTPAPAKPSEPSEPSEPSR